MQAITKQANKSRDNQRGKHPSPFELVRFQAWRFMARRLNISIVKLYRLSHREVIRTRTSQLGNAKVGGWGAVTFIFYNQSREKNPPVSLYTLGYYRIEYKNPPIPRLLLYTNSDGFSCTKNLSVVAGSLSIY